MDWPCSQRHVPGCPEDGEHVEQRGETGLGGKRFLHDGTFPHGDTSRGVPNAVKLFNLILKSWKHGRRALEGIPCEKSSVFIVGKRVEVLGSSFTFLLVRFVWGGGRCREHGFG